MAAKATTAESMSEKWSTAAVFDALLQGIGLRLRNASCGNRCVYSVVPRGLHRRGESARRDIETLRHVVDVGLTGGPARDLRRGHRHSTTDTAQKDKARRADDQLPTQE